MNWDSSFSFSDSVCSVFLHDAFVFARACTSGHLVESKKRSWESLGGTWRDFIDVCPLAAAVIDSHVDGQIWIQPHLAVR